MPRPSSSAVWGSTRGAICTRSASCSTSCSPGRCPILGERSRVVPRRPSAPAAARFRRERSARDRCRPPCAEIVLRTLAKQPEERFADAEELVWALTLIRDEGLLEPAGTAELGDAPRAAAVEEKIVPFPARPGSTQGRLDREFLLTHTPLPTAPLSLAAKPVTVALPRTAHVPPAPPDPPADSPGPMGCPALRSWMT